MHPQLTHKRPAVDVGYAAPTRPLDDFKLGRRPSFTFWGVGMRRFAMTSAPAVLAGLALLSGGTLASAATVPGFTIKGVTAGNVTAAEPGQVVTFVFTETNVGHTGRPVDLVFESVTHASIVSATCVLPGGTLINDDGLDCEPGFLHHGQSASSVVTARVRGHTGERATIRVCLTDESNGVVGPCQSVPVRVR